MSDRYNQFNLVSAEEFKNITERNPKEILRLMLQISQSSRNSPEDAFLIRLDDIPREMSKITPDKFGWLSGYGKANSLHFGLDAIATLDEAKERLKRWFPWLECLEFDGYIIAGSAAVLACSSYQITPSDIDFYPVYQPSKDIDVQAVTQESYLQWLTEMDTVRAALPEELMNHFIAMRSANCTTVKFEADPYTEMELQRWGENGGPQDILKSYQFVHRSYPSKSSVVVGFDQLACKAFYDGDDIYFTLDAALCLHFRINPLDWRRESTSFFRRIEKYESYGFYPIYPGLPSNLLELNSTYALVRGVTVNTYYNEKDKAVLTIYGDEIKKDESDYTPDDEEEHIYAYRIISLIIKERSDLIYVVTHGTPSSIINPEDVPIDVHEILTTMATGSHLSKFYMGDDTAITISNNIRQLTTGTHAATTTVTNRKILVRPENLETFSNLQRRLWEVINRRSQELQPQVDRAFENLKTISFITSNPGAQFSGSFHPIIRNNAKEFYGDAYVDFKITLNKELKIFLLWLRKINAPPFGGLGLNIMKMLFRYIDRAIIRSFFTPLPKQPVCVQPKEISIKASFVKNN